LRREFLEFGRSSEVAKRVRGEKFRLGSNPLGSVRIDRDDLATDLANQALANLVTLLRGQVACSVHLVGGK